MRAAPLRTWALFLALCLAEFLYFDARTSKHYTWIYPRWNDQIQYLTEVYTGYADARENGWGKGLWHSLTMPAAQGALDRPLVLLLFRAAGPSRSAALALNLLAWLALQAAVVAAGLAHFVECQWADPHSEDFIAGARRVNALADLIFHLSGDSGLKSPRIAVDQITDCLDGQILRVICYERHGQWVPFRMLLPTGYFAEREDVLMDRLAQSDFVLLPNDDSAGQGYPYDQEMRALRPKTQEWCRAHLSALGDFPLFGRTWTLYGRPELAPPPGALRITASRG